MTARTRVIANAVKQSRLWIAASALYARSSKAAWALWFRRYALRTCCGLLAMTVMFSSPAQAVCSSPAGVAGHILYDSADSVMVYCDGTDWVAMGPKAWAPLGVDMSSDWLQRGGDLSGISDGTTVTGAFWFEADNSSFGTTDGIYMYTNTGDRFLIAQHNVAWDTNHLKITGRDSSGTVVLEARIPQQFYYTNRGWNHFMFSFDLSDTNKRHFYFNGEEIEDMEYITYNTAGIIDFSQADHAVGANLSGGRMFDAGIEDFWLDFNTYIDLSVEANRRKFIGPGMRPVFLGNNGEGPTGTPPDVFFSGAEPGWHNNKGTGGAFTLNGNLSVFGYRVGPDEAVSEDVAVSDYAGIDSGLIGYWKMDETTGTLVADSAGSNNGTFSGGASVSSQPGRQGGSLLFDGTDDVINAGSHVSVDNLGPMSVCAWFKAKKQDSSTENRIIMKSDGAGGGWYLQLVGWNGNFIYHFRSRLNDDIAASGIMYDVWQHICVTWDGTDGTGGMGMYLNGSGNWDGSGSTDGAVYNDAGGDLFIASNGSGGDEFEGLLDEVRLYNRVLSDEEVAALFLSTWQSCRNPDGREGGIVYDTAINAMLYCDGGDWRRIGK